MQGSPSTSETDSTKHQPSFLHKHRRSLPALSLTIMAILLTLTSGLTSQAARASGVYGPMYSPADVSTTVSTYKKDLSRTGQFANETSLTPNNVNSSQFGKHVSYPVDGQVYAEPLYIPNLTIKGTTYNVVIVATEHDSIYAFDADQTTPTAPLWHTSYLGSGITTVSSGQVACNDINPEYGITSTPVIDSTNNTMYLVSNTMEHGTNTFRLHAVDITTGHDRQASHIIAASYAGNGAGSVRGRITFNPVVQGQRGGLLLNNGHIFMDFGSHCDNGNYHGWIMSYKASNLSQIAAYNDTPGGNSAGMWEAGESLTADSSNHIYVMTGNGSFNHNTGGKDLGDSFIKLDISSGKLNVLDSFTPFNQSCLNATDGDLGSGGVLLLPGNELLGVGKEGRIYVLNQNHLGGYNTIAHPCANLTRTNVDKIVQESARNTAVGGVWGTPAFWNSSNGQYVYVSGVGDHLRAFKVTNGKLSFNASSQTSQSFNYPGTNPVISSNGNDASTGIVWTLDGSATLHAYNASDLGNELYNSKQKSSRDSAGSYIKFSVPTVANGEVFVGTKSSLVIYGLLP